MKPGALLINASRGTVVDIEALAAALESGHLAGAAIDVFPDEPESNDEAFASPLRDFDNVILTPHVGGSTVEAQENIGVEVADKLVALQRHRLHAVGGELPRGVAARAPRQAPAAAHPPQRARA